MTAAVLISTPEASTIPPLGERQARATTTRQRAEKPTRAPATARNSSEMIVGGGASSGPTYFNTGGRYNPTTDSWTASSITNAPGARAVHTAVWTGSEMIIWGGGTGGSTFFNTGGRYNPGTDSWTATSLTNVPAGR